MPLAERDNFPTAARTPPSGTSIEVPSAKSAVERDNGQRGEENERGISTMIRKCPEALFKLEVTTDNPKFEGFAIEEAPSVLGRESLDDDITPGYDASETVREWSQPRLANVWKRPKVKGRVAPYNDFPGIDMVLPAFSRRACDALRDFLEPNGELLPLDSPAGEYYFYNITTIVDALDLANSKCEFWCVRWTPLSRPKNGDPSLLPRQAVVALIPR